MALANQDLQPFLPAPLKAGLPLRWLAGAALGPAEAAGLAAASGGFGPALPALVAQAAGGKGGKGGEDEAARSGLARQLAAACRSMAECLESGELGPRLLTTAADAMAEDYMRSR